MSSITYPPPAPAVIVENPLWTAAFNLNGTEGVVYTQCLQSNQWALTYDDGPSQLTSGVLDTLSRLNIKATFFVVGSVAIQHPDLLRRAYREGHEIALHTWSHPELSKSTDGQVVAQLIWAARAVKEIIGVTPAFMRPPYGDTTARTRQILNAMGLSIVLWVIRLYLFCCRP